MKRNDLMNLQSGTLLVIAPAPARSGKVCWTGRCIVCNREDSYRADALSSQTARCRHCQDARVRHGGARRGKQRDPLYGLWMGIRQRVARQEYSYPLELEPEWAARGTGFPAFKEYILGSIGQRPNKWHSLDRINVLKGYIKHNLRWADDLTQADNRTTTTLYESSAYGAALTAREWARLFAEVTTDSGRWTPEYVRKLLNLVTVDELIRGVMPHADDSSHRAGEQAWAELANTLVLPDYWWSD